MRHIKNISISLAISLFAGMPAAAFAQGAIEGKPIGIFLTRLGTIVGVATPILSAIALLIFIWGIVMFVFNSGDEDRRTEGKKFMGWSIVALFVMVSIWGIIRFIEESVFPSSNYGRSQSAPCIGGVPGIDCGSGGGTTGGGATAGITGGGRFGQ